MEFQAIIDFIQTVGFPIAMCLLCFYYMQRNDDKHDEQERQLRDTVANNTKVMEQLINKIEELIK